MFILSVLHLFLLFTSFSPCPLLSLYFVWIFCLLGIESAGGGGVLLELIPQFLCKQHIWWPQSPEIINSSFIKEMSPSYFGLNEICPFEAGAQVRRGVHFHSCPSIAGGEVPCPVHKNPASNEQKTSSIKYNDISLLSKSNLCPGLSNSYPSNLITCSPFLMQDQCWWIRFTLYRILFRRFKMDESGFD